MNANFSMVTADECYPNPDTDSVFEKEKQIATSGRRLFSLTVINKNTTTDFYLKLWDSDDAGVTGVLRLHGLIVPAGTDRSLTWDGGKKFFAGIYVKAVTTATGNTLISASDAQFLAEFTALNP